MQFEAWWVNDLDDEFEDPETQFIEAPSWLMALQFAEAQAAKIGKHLSQLSRLE